MNILDGALLYARTIARLSPKQIAARPLVNLRRRVPVAAPTAPVQIGEDSISRAWVSGSRDRADAILRGEFEFLAQREEFRSVPWRDRVRSQSWTYKLHYFEWAIDLACAFVATRDRAYIDRLEALALDWVATTGDRRGDGWDAYPTAVRVQSLIRALGIAGVESLSGGGRDVILRSLARQVRHLERNLEHHLLGNHLQKDWAALALAALAMPGAGRAPAAQALDRLWSQCDEQVLGDGCHAERSPMYHIIALTDFLEVAAFARRAGVDVPARVKDRLGRMIAALALLSRPDGTLHLVNDCANGESASVDAVLALATEALGERARPDFGGPHALVSGGYYGFDDGIDRVLFDCGALGPAHQPGHGHCDLLSFEWDVHGKPVIADSGCSGYDDLARRSYERSTAAHNTIRIGSREQAEVWGSFRVARRPVVHAVVFDRNAQSIRGSYSPYYSSRVTHQRAIERLGAGALRVRDEVRSPGAERVTAFLHFHPRWRLRSDGATCVAESSSGGRREIVTARLEGAERVAIAVGRTDNLDAWYSPRFGVTEPAPVLVYDLPTADVRTATCELRWE